VAGKRKTNIDKEKRSWRLTHEAFLLLQAMAAQQGIETSAFLEVVSRTLAQERLPPEERERIHARAEEIIRERQLEPPDAQPSSA
jgi:hypothetical protein